jgi:hypothetical protein
MQQDTFSSYVISFRSSVPEDAQVKSNLHDPTASTGDIADALTKVFNVYLLDHIPGCEPGISV